MADENKRFRDIIKKYRTYFKLSQEDVAGLIGIKQSAYGAMEIGRGNIDFDKGDQIAKVYGLRHFELMIPKRRLPSIEELPPKTKKRVLERKAEGKKTRNDYLKLPTHVIEIVSSESAPKEFTSSEVWGLLAENIKHLIKPVRITDILKKGQLKDKIEETGEKRGREKVYRLKKPIRKKDKSNG